MIKIEDISIEEAEKYGIKYKNSIMQNGEKRFRQICLKDKTAYIRAEGKETGYWQKSHYHKSQNEIYIVQKGPIVLAQYIDNKIKISKFNDGNVFKVEPNIPHNIYMCPYAVSHTVKYGDIKEYDWEPFELLDKMIKEKFKNDVPKCNY